MTSLILGSALIAAPPDKEKVGAIERGADAAFMKGSQAILDRDFPTAFDSLSRGVALGHAPSKAALGFLHFNGWGCKKNVPKARKLYEESAQAGSHQGLNNLAHLYRYGLAELDKDLPESSGTSGKGRKTGKRVCRQHSRQDVCGQRTWATKHRQVPAVAQIRCGVKLFRVPFRLGLCLPTWDRGPEKYSQSHRTLPKKH